MENAFKLDVLLGPTSELTRSASENLHRPRKRSTTQNTFDQSTLQFVQNLSGLRLPHSIPPSPASGDSPLNLSMKSQLGQSVPYGHNDNLSLDVEGLFLNFMLTTYKKMAKNVPIDNTKKVKLETLRAYIQCAAKMQVTESNAQLSRWKWRLRFLKAIVRIEKAKQSWNKFKSYWQPSCSKAVEVIGQEIITETNGTKQLRELRENRRKAREDLELAKTVININACDQPEGRTKLVMKIRSADKQGVATLLEQSADPNCLTRRGKRPIDYALLRKNFGIIRLLIDYETAEKEVILAKILDMATLGNEPLAEVLEDIKAIVSCIPNASEIRGLKTGNSLVHFFFLHDPTSHYVIRLIRDLRVDPNAKNKDGLTALHLAAEETDPSAVMFMKSLLETGANPNEYNACNERPIDLAAKKSEFGKCLLLLRHGAHGKNNEGVMSVALVDFLDSFHPEHNSTSDSICTCLRQYQAFLMGEGRHIPEADNKEAHEQLDLYKIVQQTAAFGLRGIVQELINRKNAHGNTLLHNATIRNDIAAIRFLLDHRADPELEIDGVPPRFFTKTVQALREFVLADLKAGKVFIAYELLEQKCDETNIRQLFHPEIISYISMANSDGFSLLTASIGRKFESVLNQLVGRSSPTPSIASSKYRAPTRGRQRPRQSPSPSPSPAPLPLMTPHKMHIHGVNEDSGESSPFSIVVRGPRGEELSWMPPITEQTDGSDTLDLSPASGYISSTNSSRNSGTDVIYV